MPRLLLLDLTSEQGIRPSNEDTHAFAMNLGSDGQRVLDKFGAVDFFAICDGHGGDDVSRCVIHYLRTVFLNNKITYPLQQDYLDSCYDAIQKKLLSRLHNVATECGSTAMVGVRFCDSEDREFFQVVNLGDCRTVLSRDGLAIPLNKDHKPSWIDEKIRIDEVNRKMKTDYPIYWAEGDWRILGLSVSRVFGDFSATPYVTHYPESFVHRLLPEDEFIIMACDGLWEVMENYEAVNFVRDQLSNHDYYGSSHPDRYHIGSAYPTSETERSRHISKKLASYAIAKGSGDNVTVLIIFFK